MKHNSPTAIGNRTTAIVLAALIKAGKTVSIPFGDGHSYDLVLDESHRLLRVQCKTGQLRNGVIILHLYTVNRSGARSRYAGLADLYAIYCAELDKVYMIPVAEVGEPANLRVTETQNGQEKGVRWARDYELRPDSPIKMP
jgi:hypothetical protein